MGVLMNTRGIVQLVVLNIGVQLKVISPVIFAMFVLMATVLTFLTSPILSVLYPRIDQSNEPQDDAVEHHNPAFEGEQTKVDLSTISHCSSPKAHRRRMTLF